MPRTEDIWANRLVEGDSIQLMRQLTSEGNQVDVVFADPPYNIGYSYDVYDDSRSNEEYVEWTRQWMAAANDLLKPTGAMWIAIGDEYAADIKRVADELGLTLRNWVVWYYTFGVHCTKKFSRSHTHILYFIKNEKRFTFNDKRVRVPSARQLVYNDGRAHEAGRVPDNTWILRPQDAPEGAFHPQHDVWYFARVAGTFKERAGFHGCQMPEKLLARIIESSSNEGEVVCDPFAGSGSTLVVAKKLGRQYLGFELSSEYVRQAQRRIDAVRRGDLLEGPEDPLISAPPTYSGRGMTVEVDEEKVVAAFTASCSGLTVDRVLCDPVQNAAFIEQCTTLGLAGRPRDWNLSLLKLRKRGGVLSGGGRRHPTIKWADMDEYLFASEIAFQRMLKLGFPGLDAILCDPRAVAQFDEIARNLAPGVGAFQYRWGALALRKDARLRERLVKGLESDFNQIGKPKPFKLDPSAIRKLRSVAAVYCLVDDESGREIYVGETARLKHRAERTLSSLATIEKFEPNSGRWRLDVHFLDGVDKRKALQSYLIGKTKAPINYQKLSP